MAFNLQDWFSHDTSECVPSRQTSEPQGTRALVRNSASQRAMLCGWLTLVTCVEVTWPSWWHSCTGICVTASYSTLYETCSLPKHREFQSFFLAAKRYDPNGQKLDSYLKAGCFNKSQRGTSETSLSQWLCRTLTAFQTSSWGGFLVPTFAAQPFARVNLVLTSCETGVAVGQVSDCHYATTTAGCPVWALSCWR